MADSSTCGADRSEAGRACEDFAFIVHFVDLIAIGGRTVLMLFWMCADMGGKESLEQVVQVVPRQSSFEVGEEEYGLTVPGGA